MNTLNFAIVSNYIDEPSFDIEKTIKTNFLNSNLIFIEKLDGVYDWLNQEIDLLILSLNMPINNALLSFEGMLARKPNLKTLIYAEYNEKIYGVPFIKAGAQGILHKKSDESELISAISIVLKGEKYLNPNIMNTLITDYLDNDSKFKDELSVRELQIAELIVAGNSLLEVSNKIGLKLSSLNNYKSKIYTKLNVKNIAELNEKLKFFEENKLL